MSENNYFKCIVRTEYEDSRGKMKHRRDEYIVEAVNPTDVETKITKELQGYDFDIAQITLTKIIDIIR